MPRLDIRSTIPPDCVEKAWIRLNSSIIKQLLSGSEYESPNRKERYRMNIKKRVREHAKDY